MKQARIMNEQTNQNKKKKTVKSTKNNVDKVKINSGEFDIILLHLEKQQNQKQKINKIKTK